MQRLHRDAPTAQTSGTLARELWTSLSALRASLESLAGDLDASDPRSRRVGGALDEVGRVSHQVRALLDFAAPPALAPLRCSLAEILSETVRRLPGELRPRVRVARDQRLAGLRVDGPVLARSLAYLIEDALAAGGDELLLSVRREDDRAVFALVAPAREDRGVPPGERVGRAVAQRDVQRMGGSLGEGRHGELLCTDFSLRLDGPASEAEAA